MNIKRFFAFLLAACMLCVLCACGNAEQAPITTEASVSDQPPAQTTETPVVDDGKVTYTVKVIDGTGAAMAGVAVQICKDSCMPGVTNAEGVATFRVAQTEGYKVSFLTVPEGYTAEAEEFYFEAGSTELTLTLNAA